MVQIQNESDEPKCWIHVHDLYNGPVVSETLCFRCERLSRGCLLSFRNAGMENKEAQHPSLSQQLSRLAP